MDKKSFTYVLLRAINACFLMVTLFVFTVSAPLVISKKLSKTNNLCQEAPVHAAESEEEASNPISSTEEKVPSTNNLVEEYLHNTTESHLDAVNNRLDYASHEAGCYTAFHGELLVPPPNPC